jgi:hypothetical protein
MKAKTIKAWAFVDSSGSPVLSTVANTKEDSRWAVRTIYQESVNVWESMGYRVRRIEIKVLGD